MSKLEILENTRNFIKETLCEMTNEYQVDHYINRIDELDLLIYNIKKEQEEPTLILVA